MFIFHIIRLKCQSPSEHSQNTFLIDLQPGTTKGDPHCHICPENTSELFQQEAQGEQKMALLEFGSFRGLISPADQLRGNGRTTAPTATMQSRAAAWSCPVMHLRRCLFSCFFVCTLTLVAFLSGWWGLWFGMWSARTSCSLASSLRLLQAFGRRCPFVVHAVLYVQSRGQMNPLWVPLCEFPS